jgi:serine/threonine-protein kinase
MIPHQRIGSVVNDSFRVLRLIGEGGMGAVYEAENIRLPKKYAIKFLDPALAKNADTFLRFQREAHIASAIGHEHIIEAFDFNTDEHGAPYMVLELLVGEDLAQRLDRGPLSLEQAAPIVDQVASAVGAAHALGIVHRDLKPQNIFLCQKNGQLDFVKVLDFGISKMLHGQTETTQKGTIMGTVSYMAPEQAMGRQADISAQSDIFALGIILFECLTGERAFAGDTPMSILYNICNTPLPDIRMVLPGASDELAEVLRRATAKSAADRYPSTDDLRQDLRALLGDTGADRFEHGRPTSSRASLKLRAAEPPASRSEISSRATEPAPPDASGPRQGSSDTLPAPPSSRPSAQSDRGSLPAISMTLPGRARMPVLMIGAAGALAFALIAWSVTRGVRHQQEHTGQAPLVRPAPAMLAASTSLASAEPAASIAPRESASPAVAPAPSAPVPAPDSAAVASGATASSPLAPDGAAPASSGGSASPGGPSSPRRSNGTSRPPDRRLKGIRGPLIKGLLFDSGVCPGRATEA